jgi:hypothetical protein
MLVVTKHWIVQKEFKMGLKGLPLHAMFSNVVEVTFMINLTTFMAFHDRLLPTIVNQILFTQWRCHNINGILGRHGIMWVIIIALERRGNKQSSN